MSGEEDPYKREGHLQLKITKLSEFAREKDGRRLSEPVQLLGFQWKIYATREFDCKPKENSLGFFLQCDGIDSHNDPVWTCATLKLSAQKKDKEDIVRKFGHLFRGKEHWGWNQFMKFEELMNPENGWYDEANDCIVLTADFRAGAPFEVSCYMAREDMLLVNGQEVEVNKYQLASHSRYFERFFFGGEYKENNKLEIELPATVDHFKRMLDTLHPDNQPLDDLCIEGVLHLADQFFLLEVERKCHHFLERESKCSAIFKYRLADKYGLDQLTQGILDLPKEEFSKDADFFENINEFAKLDEKAREALNAQIGSLFGKKVAK